MEVLQPGKAGLRSTLAAHCQASLEAARNMPRALSNPRLLDSCSAHVVLFSPSLPLPAQ